MASVYSDRQPPLPRDRRRDSGYRNPSEDSYDSRYDSRPNSSHYDGYSQHTAPPNEQPKSKADTLTKFALGAAIIYGVLRIWNGEKNAEKERRRKRDRRRDFEKRKAARRREDDRREREMERETWSEDEQSEVTDMKRIGYAPSRSRSRRAKSRAPEERDQSRPERSRSRGPPRLDPPSPPSMTRASNVEGHGYEEHRSKSRAR